MDEASSGTNEKGFAAKRIQRCIRFEVDAAPETIFPLLCPVREREWIAGWTADVVYSESGLIEDGCIFTTRHPQLGEAIYVTSRHEKDAGCVEFVVFYPGKCVQQLEIALARRPEGGTSVRWSRTYTGLSREGNACIEAITEDVFRQQMSTLAQSLARRCQELEHEVRCAPPEA
jgi:hypothetical protein